MRVLITRPRKDAGKFALALRNIGAQAFYLPTIEINPVLDKTCLDRALSQLHNYDWLVLTSVNAVEAVFGRMTVLGIKSLPENLRIAAVGPKTAAELNHKGIKPDFIPEEYIAEAMVPGLGDLSGRLVLLPVADIAHDTLPKAIQAADGIAHVVIAYHTVPTKLDLEGLAALRSGMDVITFTSGSTARNFVALVQDAGLDPFKLPGDPKIACIGPKTAKAAQEQGLRVDIVADTYTVDGLVAAIDKQFSKN